MLVECSNLHLSTVLFSCSVSLILKLRDADFLLKTICPSAWLNCLNSSWKSSGNFADAVFRRTKWSGTHIKLYVTAVVEKSHLETFFFLGYTTNFMSNSTSVLQEHKYQTVLTCTQLENIYFMKRMILFNSTVPIDYESHVNNKLEPYTISSTTLLKNLPFRKVLNCVPATWTQKRKKKFTES